MIVTHPGSKKQAKKERGDQKILVKRFYVGKNIYNVTYLGLEVQLLYKFL
jgi:hypothetical protein